MNQIIDYTKLSAVEHIREYLDELETYGEVADDWAGFLCCWHSYKHRHQLVFESGYKFVAFKSTAKHPQRAGDVDYVVIPPENIDWEYNPRYTISDNGVAFDLPTSGALWVIRTSDGKPSSPTQFMPKNGLEEDLWKRIDSEDLSRGLKIVTIHTMLTRLYAEWVEESDSEDRWMVLDSLVESNDTVLKSLMQYSEELK